MLPSTAERKIEIFDVEDIFCTEYKGSERTLDGCYLQNETLTAWHLTAAAGLKLYTTIQIKG